MLGLRVHQLPEPVVLREGRVEVCEEDQRSQDHQDNDVQFLPEEHPEHGLPIGVSGSCDLLGLQVAVIRHGKQLRLAQAQVAVIIFHTGHLSFVAKEIRGSTAPMRRSPRIREVTLSTA